jgi:hypothetical protein
MLKMVSFHIQAHLNAFIDNSLGHLARESLCTMKRWTEGETIKFVELYRDYECLWDTTKVCYKNNRMRQAAVWLLGMLNIQS